MNCTKQAITMILLALILSLGASIAWAAEEEVIFYNGNDFGVHNGYARNPSFTLVKPYTITYAFTYHYRYAGSPGTIGFSRPDGTIVGTWQATGQKESPYPSWYWEIRPGVTLPAGTYSVFVSLPATWSYNSLSGNNGMVKIKGYPAVIPDTPGTTISAKAFKMSETEYEIRWSPVVNTKEYVISYAGMLSWNELARVDGSTTSYRWNTNSSYKTLRVSTVPISGPSISADTTVQCMSPITEAPKLRIFEVTGGGPNTPYQVRIEWSASNANKYRVETVASTGNAWIQRAEVPGNVTAVTLTVWQEGTWIRVIGVNHCGSSEPSNIVKVYGNR